MFREIKEDLKKRLENQPDSRCASPDEVRIAWLICNLEESEKLLKKWKKSVNLYKLSDSGMNFYNDVNTFLEGLKK